jgi:transposase-like protein
MQMFTVTRGQLKAGIALAGVDRAVLAREAGINATTLRHWVRGKNDEPFSANCLNLSRILAAIEMRGVRFTPDGVVLQRARGELPVPTITTTTMAATA